MKRRRCTVALAALILTCLTAVSAEAHVDEQGVARIEAKATRLSSSAGYYQYMLSWKLRGRNHNRYDTHFFRIEYAYNNQTVWHTYANIDRHVDQSFPMPLHRWYRVRAGGLPCFLDACAWAVRSYEFWIPAQRCGGAGTPLID